ncbi:MAG: hypothetical protein ABR533_05225, partial [Desulfonatronovibrio sp.]
MSLHNIQNERAVALIQETIKNKNWAKAIKLCNNELMSSKEKTTADIFAFLSTAYRYSGKNDIASKIIEQALTKFPENSIIRQEKAELQKPENSWPDPELYLDRLQKITIPKIIQYKQTDKQLNDLTKTQQLKINNSVFENEDYEALLAYNAIMQNQIEKTDVQATSIYKILLQGKSYQAERLFFRFTNTLDLSSTAIDLWNNAFNKLADIVEELGYSQKNDKPALRSTISTVDYKSTHKKIISSGMGWSGSGALTAYLREFHQVDYIDVSEFNHIEGPYGLAGLRWFKGNNYAFIDYLINMFAYTLFGFGLCDNSDNRYEIEKSKLKSRKFINYIPYIEGICLFLEHNRRMHNETKGINYNIFYNASNILIDKICESFASSNNSIFLMDNVIHIQELKNIDYLSNTQIVCVYRDPRSNYVALVEEDWKRGRIIQTKGAAAYAKFYQRMRRKSELSLRHHSHQAQNVQHVQFERFVSCPDC